MFYIISHVTTKAEINICVQDRQENETKTSRKVEKTHFHSSASVYSIIDDNVLVDIVKLSGIREVYVSASKTTVFQNPNYKNEN